MLSDLCQNQVFFTVRKDTLIRYITTDSREIGKGDLFVALDGNNDTGRKYIQDAKAKGALTIADSHDADVHSANSTDTLLHLAFSYKQKLQKLHNTVAITGSVGKSTTKEYLTVLSAATYKTHASKDNYNNHIGVPHTILTAPSDTEVLIIEMGMNHENEISKLSKCASPDISAITNIGTSHIGNLKSKENIARAKSEISLGMKGGPLLVPFDEVLLKNVHNRQTFSINDSNADYSLIKKGGSLIFSTPIDTQYFDFLIPAEHLQTDLCIALSIASLIGISSDLLKKFVHRINHAKTRQRFIKMGDMTLFDDSYNSSYESILADLQYLSSSFKFPIGAFLGDILELGSETERIYKMIGEAVCRYKISNLYLCGKKTHLIAQSAIDAGFEKRNIHVNTDTEDIKKSIHQIEANHLKDEIILFKASHKFRFDKIADAMEKKEKENA